MTEEVKTELEKSIFPEANVGDIIIKPWKFGILFQISGFIGEILDTMESKNISIEGDPITGLISYSTIARIFAVAATSILKIMAITLKKPEEEIEEFDMDEGLEIAYTIYKQNFEQIKKILNDVFIKKLEDERT